MKPMKDAEQAVPAQQEPASTPESARRLLAQVREQLIKADLDNVARPNELLVRGIAGTAVVAVGYADPDIRTLTVSREFRLSPMKPGTNPNKPGLFRAWEYLHECPRPYTKQAGHSVWLFAVSPTSIQVPRGVELNLPEVAGHPNLGTREYPLHGTVRQIVQLPQERWTKKMRENPEIRRIFELDSWVYLERQPVTNWLVGLVEFVGDIPSDFSPEHDRLQVTVAARPAALGWMTHTDAAAACEAARLNQTVITKSKIIAAPPQSKAEALRNMI